mmetsp:Transcript_14879/g.43693  ORF Transcript_14879/g.43693 Transcript_14879/m.43693 type:complete len:260 (-) Transcript_14879:759-1538(-)
MPPPSSPHSLIPPTRTHQTPVSNMIPRSPPTSHTISENRPLRGDPTPHAPHSPVDVGVKHDAQVGAHLAHCLGARLHRGWVLRVRDVVGEGAVRIQEAGAGHVSAQWRQHLVSEEASGAVACVDDDLKAGEWELVVSLAVHALLDEVPQEGGVGGHELNLIRTARLHRHRGAQQVRRLRERLAREHACRSARVGRALQQLRNVGLLQAARLCEELDAVGVERHVRRRQHDRALVPACRHNGVEHARRRRDTKRVDVRAG